MSMCSFHGIEKRCLTISLPYPSPPTKKGGIERKAVKIIAFKGTHKKDLCK